MNDGANDLVLIPNRNAGHLVAGEERLDLFFEIDAAFFALLDCHCCDCICGNPGVFYFDLLEPLVTELTNKFTGGLGSSRIVLARKIKRDDGADLSTEHRNQRVENRLGDVLKITRF